MLADRKGCGLDELSLDDMRGVEPRLDQSVFKILDLDQVARARASFGGTAPAEVEAHIAAARARYLG